MTVQGYLAPVAEPHVYKHVPEDWHRLLHALASPVTLEEAAAYGGYNAEHLRNRIVPAIRTMLHIDSPLQWRVALTRLYYGIDRCWCQTASIHSVSIR